MLLILGLYRGFLGSPRELVGARAWPLVVKAHGAARSPPDVAGSAGLCGRGQNPWGLQRFSAEAAGPF